MLYRYEEKESGLGIFRIMDDIFVNPSISYSLTKVFDDNMKLPPDSIRWNVKYKCYFTEEGNKFFKENLEKIITKFEYEGFEVNIISIDENSISKDDILYRDNYQVIIKNNISLTINEERTKDNE